MKNIDWKLIGIIAVVILTLVLGVFLVFQSVQNRAYSLEEQVTASFADVEVQEKRRVDLVYNLADCVKQYDAHEADILKTIASSRNEIEDSENLRAKFKAVAEAYPELKSNENYINLMNELSTTENLIAEYRSNCNAQVKAYKRYIRKFPNRNILNCLGYETVPFAYLEFSAPSDAPQNLFD